VRELRRGHIKVFLAEKRAKGYAKNTVWLMRHVAWLKAEALRCGWGEPEWLFPNDEGRPHEESRVRKFHKRGLKDAKLPSFRLYDLRHTYASLLLAAGAPITYVSAQLGHSNPDLEPNRPETANRALSSLQTGPFKCIAPSNVRWLATVEWPERAPAQPGRR
jgi:integrase